ncbi:MAG: Wzz/FepE/Etk N-terminal domain-containing protein [Pseudomonadota bacterium]|nr:Wzz/FepE/Etk N-terminal domain-containing protein [Pseudomonadota bacterium]
MNNNPSNPPPQNQPPPPQYYYPDDEISLIDLWNTLMRRKKILIAVFVLVVVAAGIYLLLAKPVYESQVMINVGKIGQVGKVIQVLELEDVEQIGRIEDVDILEQRLLTEYPGLDRIETRRKGARNIVTLVSTDNDRDKAQENLQSVVNDLLDTHRNRYHELLSPMESRRDSLQRRLNDYRRQIDELDIQIRQLRAQSPEQAAILMIEKGNVMRAIPDLEEKLAELQFATSEPQSMPTRQIGEIKTPAQPVKPKPGLVMALSVVLGLMLGIFAAFFAEFIAKARTTAMGKEM